MKKLDISRVFNFENELDVERDSDFRSSKI